MTQASSNRLSRRRLVRVASGVALLAAGPPLMARCGGPLSRSTRASSAKVPQIGILGPANAAAMAFVQALQDLGWVDGETIRLLYNDRMNELRVSGIDLFVSQDDAYSRAARSATSTVPIVMINSADPVGLGLVASLAQPGGNVTGLSVSAAGLAGKRLDLLKQGVPGVRPVAVLWDAVSPFPSSATDLRETQEAATALGLHLDIVQPRALPRVDDAIAAARASGEALVLIPSGSLALAVGAIAALALSQQLPTIYPWRQGADRGGLIAYAANTEHLFRRAAGYVDKILKGARPAELPVEQPTKFDFVINLKAAQALGLTIPPSMLAQVTEIIQ